MIQQATPASYTMTDVEPQSVHSFVFRPMRSKYSFSGPNSVPSAITIPFGVLSCVLMLLVPYQLSFKGWPASAA